MCSFLPVAITYTKGREQTWSVYRPIYINPNADCYVLSLKDLGISPPTPAQFARSEGYSLFGRNIGAGQIIFPTILVILFC